MIKALRKAVITAVIEEIWKTNGTVYLYVVVDNYTDVPMEYTSNDIIPGAVAIILNVSERAISHYDDEDDTFLRVGARFSGVHRDMNIPWQNIFQAGDPNNPLNTVSFAACTVLQREREQEEVEKSPLTVADAPSKVELKEKPAEKKRGHLKIVK